METIKLSKKDAFRKWQRLNSLATNAIIPDSDGWYAMGRAADKLESATKPIVKMRTETEKKWLERDNSGRFTGNLKPGLKFEDYEKEIEDIEAGDDIEVEIYSIRLSTLKDATMPNMMGIQAKIPPSIIIDLREWIIDDYEENKEKEQKPDNPDKIDIPRIPAKK